MSRRQHSLFYDRCVNSIHHLQLRRYVEIAQGGRCARCRDMKPLQLHHKHYRTLGNERLQDVEALCVDCHKIADKEREKRTWENRVAGWAAKKYGAKWTLILHFQEAEAELVDWLHRKKLS